MTRPMPQRWAYLGPTVSLTGNKNSSTLRMENTSPVREASFWVQVHSCKLTPSWHRHLPVSITPELLILTFATVVCFSARWRICALRPTKPVVDKFSGRQSHKSCSRARAFNSSSVFAGLDKTFPHLLLVNNSWSKTACSKTSSWRYLADVMQISCKHFHRFPFLADDTISTAAHSGVSRVSCPALTEPSVPLTHLDR